MSKLLLNKAFSEHCNEVDIGSSEELELTTIRFKDKEICIKITQQADSKKLTSSYYIGVDWLKKNDIAVYIAPKLNDETQQTDYLKMLFSSLRHSDVSKYVDDLYEIKFEQPFIEIEQQQDLLTPLLVVHFLQVLKVIVRKGLKKSYYKVEKNLNAKVKGKVLVSQTLKQNITKNKPTQTYCEYSEFGFNCVENRILKKTLVFIQKYLALFPDYSKLLSSVIDYCTPAFHGVDDSIDTNTIKNLTHNSFFKEYKEAIHLSNLILKRFGYAIKEIEALNNTTVKVPPFWIDMPKLFELYVLGLLKDKYHNQIRFQIQGNYKVRPDFILTTKEDKFIIDTKYKKIYQKDAIELEDIRQISGYARDTKILSQLGYIKEQQQDLVTDCLIIYPDQEAPEDLNANLKKNPINGFTRFYKMPIKLPELSLF